MNKNSDRDGTCMPHRPVRRHDRIFERSTWCNGNLATRPAGMAGCFEELACLRRTCLFVGTAAMRCFQEQTLCVPGKKRLITCACFSSHTGISQQYSSCCIVSGVPQVFLMFSPGCAHPALLRCCLGT